jgi:aerobic carbon-monoxide dehydrogenase large subunit
VTDERSESFVSDSHGRDHEMTAELALDAEGNFLAVRVTGYGNLGAYVGRGAGGPPTAKRGQEHDRRLQDAGH